MNVLFVGGGRRVEYANLFMREKCKVFGYELAKEVPIADIGCEVFVGKEWRDEAFEVDIIRKIKDNNIKLVIPLDCNGVFMLSKLKSKCSKYTNIITSDKKSCEICLDKIKLQNFMRKNFEDWYPFPQIDKPYVSKPQFGYGSSGIEYGAFYSKNLSKKENIVVQNRLMGQEYSVDAYFNKQGKLVGACSRKRLWTSGGEVIESETIDNPKLIEMTKKIGENLLLKASTCFQYIENDKSEPKLIEINARAGGGNLLAAEAGLNFAKLIIDEYLLEKEIVEDSIKCESGVYLSRSFRDHFFRNK